MKTGRPSALSRRCLLWLLATILLSGCLGPARAGDGAGASLDLDAKIGQMLMVGFRGAEVDVGHFILRDIGRNLGGVILFDRDHLTGRAVRNILSPPQLAALTTTLREAAALPLLVAIDQEGGMVSRLDESRGFPPTFSHSALGRLGDPGLTEEKTAPMAEALAEVGIGLNLAPVVDLCLEPENPVIARYGRCFSADPTLAADHARRFVLAHRQSGVLTALKHFPGHGNSKTDSHLGFVDVTGSWSEVELEPYRRLIEAGSVDAVMTAHVFNARLDDRYPATLSSAVLTGILRGQLGFDGVIISDDMQMGAIADNYSLEEAIEKAIGAGVDILLFGNNLAYDEKIVPRAVGIIKDLVRRGAVSEKRIDESYLRIMRLKSRLGSG